MKPFMLFCFGVLSTLCSHAQMQPTGDGGWVLKPTTMQHGVVPAIGIQYIQIGKTDQGHLRIFFQSDAVDESVGGFYLQPRVNEEKNSRSTPIFLRKVSNEYEFATVAMFSVGKDGELLFANEKIEAFEVFRTSSTPISN